MRTIQLQSVGHVPAQPAGNIKQGDRLMWNFGHIYKVVGIEKETEKSIFIYEQSMKGGMIYSRQLLKSRLVAIL